jgi:hypothetical protein
MLTTIFFLLLWLYVARRDGSQSAMRACVLLVVFLLVATVGCFIPLALVVAMWAPPNAELWWFDTALWLTLHDGQIYLLTLVCASITLSLIVARKKPYDV